MTRMQVTSPIYQVKLKPHTLNDILIVYRNSGIYPTIYLISEVFPLEKGFIMSFLKLYHHIVNIPICFKHDHCFNGFKAGETGRKHHKLILNLSVMKNSFSHKNMIKIKRNVFVIDRNPSPQKHK